MPMFEQYFLMQEADVCAYVRQKLPEYRDMENLACAEIGDGNLNYVFKVTAPDGRAVIVKQAGHQLRISEDITLSPDRNRIEAEILLLQDKLAPGFVPKIYSYDTTMCASIMEYLDGYDLMRTALMRHEIFPQFAGWITTFMVDSLLPTTDVVMEHKAKKLLQRQYVNPELCGLTEDLVFTEPYNDRAGRNNVFPPLAGFVRRELYGDGALHAEVAKLKFGFMNNAQALLHGDLHTGSIFIKQGSLKVFDPEFAFYGPMGYEIGNVIANMMFAWCNGEATIADAKELAAYRQWTESVITDVADLTRDKMTARFGQWVTEEMAKAPGFSEWYIADVMADTAGTVGLELNRRTVGMANVIDLTQIADQKARAIAEATCILAAKQCIMNRAEVRTGADYLRILHAAKIEATVLWEEL